MPGTETARPAAAATSAHGEPTIESARLSTNLSPAVAQALKSIVERRGISITEAVRRAIALYDYVDRLDPERDRLQVVSADGRVREIVRPGG